MRIIKIVISIMLTSVVGIFAQPPQYYVAINGNNGDSGTDPNHPWRTITYAVSHVVLGTPDNPATINVASGVYNRAHEGSFPISLNRANCNLVIRGAGTENTIIDADGAADPWDEYYVFDLQNSANFEIRDLKVTHGRGGIRIRNQGNDLGFYNLSLEDFILFPDDCGLPALNIDNVGGELHGDGLFFGAPTSLDDGGGMLITAIDGDVTLTGIEMVNPRAKWGNGGALNATELEGNLTLTDWTLEEPYSNDDGGGIYVNGVQGDVLVNSLNVTDANARYNHGGGCYFRNISGTLRIEEATFTSPRADDHGGAILAWQIIGELTIQDVDITESEGQYGQGGAIYIKDVDSEAHLNNITVLGTLGGNQGGGIYIYDVADSLILTEVTIEDAVCDWEEGGGIYLSRANGGTLFSNVTIRNAYADEYGGGIYAYDLIGDMRFQGITIEDCEAHGNDGGGIYFKKTAFADSLVFEDLALCRNRSLGSGGNANGGGGMFMDLLNDQVQVRISNFSIIGNSSGRWGHGGGMLFYKVNNLVMTEGTFKDNSTCEADGCYEYHGGGLYLYTDGAVTLRNMVFWDNLARGSGGAIYANAISTSFDLFNIVFMGNKAEAEDQWSHGEGGAVYFSQSNASGPAYKIRNALFADNHAGRDGGAIFIRKGSLHLVNLTTASNQAALNAPSIYCHRNGGANVYNSIVWGNGAGGGNHTTYLGTNLYFYYSDVERDGGAVAPGAGNININPYYFSPSDGRYNVRFGSRTLDAGMPDDPGAPNYIAAYANYSHEPEPNYGRINMGFWGMTTGAGLVCEHCDGEGSLIVGGGGSGGGGGGGLPIDYGFGGAAGGATSEAILNVVRDKYILMGVPVIPDLDNLENDPQAALGDDLNNTVPNINEQTWRFSRWANNYNCPQIPGGIYRGYLRYDENEPRYGGVDYGDIGDPPLIVPGLGYWFVFNYGARTDYTINVDVPRMMLDAEDYIVLLESMLEGDASPALNMIANPWPFPIDWADVRFSTDQEDWLSPDAASAPECGWVDAYAYTWDHYQGYYVPKNRRVEVWEGFWIVVNTTEPLWIKFPPQVVADDVPTLETDELDEILDWSLLLTAQRVDRLQVDYQNWIGVGEGLSNQRDEYDALQFSPQAREAIFLRTRTQDPINGNLTNDKLTYDFRANDMVPDEPKAWLVEVLFYVDDPAAPNAYPVDVSIRWPTITGVPENIQLSIYQFVFPFNPAEQYRLIDDLRNAEEYIVHVSGTIGGYPDYRIGRFWLVATEQGVFNNSPENSSLLPRETRLAAIAPNPFNNTTTIHFEIARETLVKLRLFNLLGQEVKVLEEKRYAPGYYEFVWSADETASGVYFVRFEAEGIEVQMRKMVLMR